MSHETELLSRKQEIAPTEKKNPEKKDDMDIETTEELNLLAVERIKSAEQEAEAFSGESEARMGQVKDLIGLPEEKVDEIGASLDVKNNLGKINEKASQLLSEMRSKIKSVTAIGMATLALGGAGNFERGMVAGLVKSETSITDTKLDANLKPADLEQKEVFNEENAELRKEIIAKVEKIRQNMISHMESKDYRDRLRVEIGRVLNYDKNSPDYDKKIDKFSQAIFSMRLERLKKVRIVLLPADEIGTHENNNEKNGNVLAFYSGKGEIYLPLEKPNEDVIFHELSHTVASDEDDLLKESYITQNSNQDSYLGSSSERRAFKSALDQELENLGIKKYGEKFTQEHFNKMIECDEQGKFSPGARVFIRTTKPELFEKIFNEVADNEVDKKSKIV